MESTSDLRWQDSICTPYTDCCGCKRIYAETACKVDVPRCTGTSCVGVAPPEVSSICSPSGEWIIESSYSGPLTVNGTVVVEGNYTLEKEQLLVFWGVWSQMKVLGKVSINEAMLLYMDPRSSEKIKKETKVWHVTSPDDGSPEGPTTTTEIEPFSWTYFVSTNGDNNPNGIPEGAKYTLYAKSDRSCLYSKVIETTGTKWGISAKMEYKDYCNLRKTLPIILGSCLSFTLLAACVSVSILHRKRILEISDRIKDKLGEEDYDDDDDSQCCRRKSKNASFSHNGLYHNYANYGSQANGDDDDYGIQDLYGAAGAYQSDYSPLHASATSNKRASRHSM